MVYTMCYLSDYLSHLYFCVSGPNRYCELYFQIVLSCINSDFLSFCSESLFFWHDFVIHNVYLSLVLMTPGQINEAWFVLIAGLIIVPPPLMTLSEGGVDYEV